MKNLVWLWCSMSMLVACERTHELGSDCPDGVCPRAAGRAEPACLVRESSRLIHVLWGDSEVPPDPPIDLSIYLESRADFGSSRVYWRFGADWVLPNGETLRACDELPYLETPEPDDYGAELFSADTLSGRMTPRLVCRVKQAKRSSDGAFESDGWYYDEDPPVGGQGLLYSPGVAPVPNDTSIWATNSGAESISRNGTLKETDPGVCSLPDDSAMHESDVGRSCSLTSAQEGGYGDDTVVIEAGSTQCATGACLLYHLAGDPKKRCGKTNNDRSCQTQNVAPSEEEVAKRVYCTCRCDAPEGDPGELCTCNPGFSCEPVLLQAPPGLRGSYCVKDGTISPFVF